MASQQVMEILQELWTKNKAKGLIAQGTLQEEVAKGSFGRDASEKIFRGCWLMAPTGTDFHKFRFCFFVHPSVLKAGDVGDSGDPCAILGKTMYRPFHGIAEFLAEAGIGVNYAVAVNRDGTLPLDAIKAHDYSGLEWRLFAFQNGRFSARNSFGFFSLWDGGRGHATYNTGKNERTVWDKETEERMTHLSDARLEELLLNELFVVAFVKGTLHKPTSDLYDIDSFLMSISQKHIFPMEIKEKFARAPVMKKDSTSAKVGRYFGIDAGRILMLLRVCLPNDANAIYLIREVEESTHRFLGWKYSTLGDVIMSASWNLQGGGVGMKGGGTQVVRLPYEIFRNFDEREISEDSLKSIGSLPEQTKIMAKQFSRELEAKFG
jgi:hypothetical protein